MKKKLEMAGNLVFTFTIHGIAPSSKGKYCNLGVDEGIVIEGIDFVGLKEDMNKNFTVYSITL